MLFFWVVACHTIGLIKHFAITDKENYEASIQAFKITMWPRILPCPHCYFTRHSVFYLISGFLVSFAMLSRPAYPLHTLPKALLVHEENVAPLGCDGSCWGSVHRCRLFREHELQRSV